MKKSNILIFAVLVLSSVSLLADNISPRFSEDGKFIELDSQWGLCGGLTITPKGGSQDIKLESFRTDLGIFTKVENIEKVGEAIPNVAGSRYKYDWGGSKASYGYNIYCISVEQDKKSVQVNCKDVVTLKDIRHNVPCIGAAGPNADYGSLNMYRNAAKIN